MKDSYGIGKNGPFLRKSYEVSYALWRVAANIAERNLADKFFEKAIELIGLAAENEYGKIAGKLDGLETLLHFATDIGSVSNRNAGILFQEIEHLKLAIPAEVGEKADVDIADIFEPAFQVEDEEMPETKIENLEIVEEPNGFESGNKKNRQSAILERIRQIGNCRLGDLLSVLPDASERTIRYDLETLVERGLIDRIGTGGRSVYYRIKQ